MANSHNKNAKESENPENILMDDDNISEKTAQTGAKWDYIAKELREITLHFEFVVKHKEDFQPTMIQHTSFSPSTPPTSSTTVQLMATIANT
jgi:hypothetical protein